MRMWRETFMLLQATGRN